MWIFLSEIGNDNIALKMLIWAIESSIIDRVRFLFSTDIASNE